MHLADDARLKGGRDVAVDYNATRTMAVTRAAHTHQPASTVRTATACTRLLFQVLLLTTNTVPTFTLQAAEYGHCTSTASGGVSCPHTEMNARTAIGEWVKTDRTPAPFPPANGYHHCQKDTETSGQWQWAWRPAENSTAPPPPLLDVEQLLAAIPPHAQARACMPWILSIVIVGGVAKSPCCAIVIVGGIAKSPC